MNSLKKNDNPYTLQFSYHPPLFINRTLITDELLNNFTRRVPTYRGVFVTGVRGCGKTVMLAEIRNRLSQEDNWISVDINPEGSLLASLAANLYMMPELRSLFIKASLDFSIIGIGAHIENAEMVASDDETAVRLMLNVLKKKGIKLLVTIDEITYSQSVAIFFHALSSYTNSDLDIYVLMTGLRDNINNIKNKPSLTFLYRAKIVELDALNVTLITDSYQKSLNLSKTQAEDIAYKTRGYSLAFQAFGYHYWNAISDAGKYEKVDISETDRMVGITLTELAYDKIWDELSETDKRIVKAMVMITHEKESDLAKVEDIRAKTDMTSDSFSKYRERLIQSGIADGKQYGYLKFALPLFDEFVSAKR